MPHFCRLALLVRWLDPRRIADIPLPVAAGLVLIIVGALVFWLAGCAASTRVDGASSGASRTVTTEETWESGKAVRR